jgi:hypothetical protein
LDKNTLEFFLERFFHWIKNEKKKNIKNLNKGAYVGRRPHYFFIQGSD